MANRTKLPDDPEVAKAIIEAESKDKGLVGRLIGTKDHAPTNIALIALVLNAALLGAVIFVPVQVEKGLAFTTLTGSFTLILGYLFGRSQGSN